jgi:uncharacterized protein (DUF58 family)
VITEVLAYQPRGRGTDLAAALRHLTRVQRRRAVVFVVSDFLAEGYESALAIAARRHDLIPVVISDPLEEELAGLEGIWPVRDAETGQTVLIDFDDERTRRAYAELAGQRREKRDKLFRKLSLDAVRVQPGDDYVQPLAALFRARSRRRAA